MRAKLNAIAVLLICACLICYAGFTSQSPDVSTTPLYNISGSVQSNPHAVIGSVALSLGTATVTLSGSSAYSSTSSYVCSGSDTSGTVLAVSTQNQSASSFKLFGTMSNTVTFSCIGN